MLRKNFSRKHFEIFILFFPENRIRNFIKNTLGHLMQAVFLRDNLHEISNPMFLENIRKKRKKDRAAEKAKTYQVFAFQLLCFFFLFCFLWQ